MPTTSLVDETTIYGKQNNMEEKKKSNLHYQRLPRRRVTTFRV